MISTSYSTMPSTTLKILSEFAIVSYFLKNQLGDQQRGGGRQYKNFMGADEIFSFSFYHW